MATPPIPPRPVSYVSSATADVQDQTIGTVNLYRVNLLHVILFLDDDNLTER